MQNRAVQRGLRLLVLLLGAALLVTGCGGKKHDRGTLEGFAFAGHPLVGATVQAVDMHGKVIATAPEKTLPSGLWFMPLDDPPSEFTLVATGGTDDGLPFKDQVRRRVRDYTHRVPRSLDVNLPTTLIDDYLTVHKDADYNQSAKKVAAFLGIPKGLNAESDVSDAHSFFSSEKFMEDARKAGGVDKLVTRLQRELDSGKKTHLFIEPTAKRSLQDVTILGSVVSNFSALTSTLSGAGSITGIVTGIIGAINSEKQTALLEEIANELQSIADSITVATTDINEVDKDVQQSEYNNAVDTDDVSEITNDLHDSYGPKTLTLWELYEAIVDAAANGSASDLTAAETNFENAMNSADLSAFFGLGKGPDAIYNALVSGTNGKTGALMAWQHLTSNRFVTTANQQRTAYALNYWLGIQAQVIALDAAYAALLENPPGSSTTTTTTTTTTTPAPTSSPCDISNPSQAEQYACDVQNYEASYGADAEKAASANCTPLSSDDSNYYAASGDNKLEDELDDSGTCVTQLPADFDLIVDQATGLMWDPTLAKTTYDVANEASPGFVQPLVAQGLTGWSYPSLSQLETLESLDEGQWNATGLPVEESSGQINVTEPIDMLSGYAGSPFFKRIWTLDFDTPGATEPTDFSVFVWASNVVIDVYDVWGDGYALHDVLALDSTADKVYTMCGDATGQVSDCSTNAATAAAIGGTHADDYANFMEVRPLAAGEVYTDGVGPSG